MFSTCILFVASFADAVLLFNRLHPSWLTGTKDAVRIFGCGTKPDSTAIIVGRKAVVACEHSLQLIRTLSADKSVVEETYNTEYWVQIKTKRGPRDGFSPDGRIKVRLYKCHPQNDWALLYRVNGMFDPSEVAVLDTVAAEMSEDEYYDIALERAIIAP